MTQDQIKETIAARLWKAQSEMTGTPESVTRGRTTEAFADSGEGVRAHFNKYATAVMALVGPKPLEFNRKGAARVGRSIYVVLESEFDDGAGEIWYVMLDGKTLSSLGQFNDEESAQAAAQAHADAAHWGNTALGELE